MSSDIPNLDRVGPAAVAIGAYVEAVSSVGRDYDRGSDESLLDAIADLLTDLRHYCAAAPTSVDFEALVERSAARFAEEVAKAEAGEGVQDLNTGTDLATGLAQFAAGEGVSSDWLMGDKEADGA